MNTNNSENIDDLQGDNLEMLSPLDKKDDEKVKKYLRHLKNAIDNNQVKNLALTGVYGSGKSTIIKSFKSRFPDVKTLDISLASFDEGKKYEDFKEEIQRSILQQIIYSQKADKLPESRINRIQDVNIWVWKHWSKTLVLLLFITSLYFLLFFYKPVLNPLNWLKGYNLNWGATITFIVFVVSFFFIGQFLNKHLLNSKLKKVSVKGEADFDSNQESKDFLNKHIDEILYFFETNQTDIVIIEDLDRFNTTEIYRVLREINYLVNTYLRNLNQKKHKKVTFLYAIKDDLFANELDRTKFFDLIIPIIPFVNYNNSKNVLNLKLDSLFKNDSPFKRPSKEFVNAVATFIIDNRTLLNIINEFIIYKEHQKLEGGEELNPEKLLAIIIYKNLRPKDFAKLHSGKSNIDITFAVRNKLNQRAIDLLENNISQLESEIQNLRTKSVENIQDLNTIYLYYIRQKINNNNAVGLKYENNKITFNKLIENGADLNLFYDEQIEWYINNTTVYSTDITTDYIDSLTGYIYKEEYHKIMEANPFILEKEKQIKKLRQEITKIKQYNLKATLSNNSYTISEFEAIFGNFYSNDENEFDKAFNDSLLMFLLKNGYINEEYKEYISIFQQGGLTEKDQEFKVNLISQINEPKPFEYELTNIQEIISELPLSYFEDSRILNFNLIDFIIVHKRKYQDQLKSVCGLISTLDNRAKQILN